MTLTLTLTLGQVDPGTTDYEPSLRAYTADILGVRMAMFLPECL